MTAINLHRLFTPLRTDGENVDWGHELGRKYGGWIGWDELILKKRVILLAEARSGKTEEFRLRASVLREQGSAAFFLRVEDLAEGPLSDGLTPEDEARFSAWRDGEVPGWFFIDSVDEARLNRKSFDRALKSFRRDVGSGLDRTHVFISCRVSDWKGKQDRDLVLELLPLPSKAAPEDQDFSPENLLLGPVFKEKSRPAQAAADASPDEYAIVRLVELTKEQRALLAQWAGIGETDAFIQQVERNGLATFAERPGDLLELAEYWKAHGTFASFTEMLRFAISEKLAEPDVDRADADTLTGERVREGAERVAAALTLGKALTLRAPGQDADPTLAAGALDPSGILPDWTPAQRAALMRRGIFTPATYGRIRFHHRSTQEYLTAQWLRRALETGCPRSEIMALLFAEPYGVRTVVPSMRSVAAWLSQNDPQLRDEVLEREPLELIRYGDPRSLPIPTRARLLTVYADRHTAGQVSDDHVDWLALWMFADPALAPAIREAWERNSDPSFRIDLLHLVREGVILECVDLARLVAFDTAASPYLRYTAIGAMEACNDRESLALLAGAMLADPSVYPARDAVHIARHLFPIYLTRSDLIHLIDAVKPETDRMEGFASYLDQFWERCPPRERPDFLEQLADLCLTPPFRSEYNRVSGKHRHIATELAPLALDVAVTHRTSAVPASLVKACAAIERSEENLAAETEQALRNALAGWREFNRDLFWFDVHEAQRNGRHGTTELWELGSPFRRSLWSLSSEDGDWLLSLVAAEPIVEDRWMALRALISVWNGNMLHSRADEVRAAVEDSESLTNEFAAALQPPASNSKLVEIERTHEAFALRQKRREKKERQSWVRFAARLQSDSSHFRDPVRLRDWKYSGDLLALTKWLSGRTGEGKEAAARHWRLLREGFGDEVAQAYRAGMKLLWRITPPKSRARAPGEPNEIDWRNILSWYGIGLESDEGEGWADRLTPEEAERAVLHAFSVGERVSEWLEALARTYPDRIKPLVEREVEAEWVATFGEARFALNGIARGGDEYLLQMGDLILERIRRRPGSVDTFDLGLRALARLPLTAAARVDLTAHATEELRSHAAESGWALRQVALLFICDFAAAVDSLEWWLSAAATSDERATRGEMAFAILFSRHWPLVPIKIPGQPVGALLHLVRLAYHTIHIADDVHHEGIFTPNRRDDAEDARGRLLEALLEIPGRETYAALCELADDPHLEIRRKRFLELAHRHAERDAELHSWTPADVLVFEERHAAPAKSGHDLFRIACAILDDIHTGFARADASSRRVLASALDEESVQQWLAEQFELRAKDRFHVVREPEVAERKKPDILLSSTSAPVEVALEVKHGGKEWTLRDLSAALSEQLAKDYLLPGNRRHGIFVVTNHRPRVWRDPEDGSTLDFEQVIERLGEMAATLLRNDTGPIEVAVFGLQASREHKQSKR